MKTLQIEICACAECVMNGAMDIMQSAEELLAELPQGSEATVTPVKCLGESKHGVHAPRVSIDGVLFDSADSQTIMAEIISCFKKDGE